MMRKALIFIFQITVTFGIIYGFYLLTVYMSAKKDATINHNAKTTVCEVINQGYKKGSYVDVVYYIDGKKIIKRENTYFSATEFIPTGEKYIIKYDSLNPTEAYIMFESPVFLEDEITLSVSGKVEKITDRNVCYYSYYVGEKRFERFQKLSDNIVAEIGKNYIVKYLVNDPLRSIIIVE
jgi:hypothetical protein